MPTERPSLEEVLHMPWKDARPILRSRRRKHIESARQQRNAKKALNRKEAARA